MSNSYSQFSEEIVELTPEMAEWIETVLGRDAREGDDLEKLVKELDIEGKEVDLVGWPDFNWKLEGAQKCSLWLYCDEGWTEDHLTLFVQALIRKYMPDYVFSVTGSCTESKPLIGAFGGWWLVVSKDDVRGGSTWDAAHEAAKEIQAKVPDPEKEALWARVEARFHDGDFDDEVHTLVSKQAAAINNDGLREQFEYLYKEAGKDWWIELLASEDSTGQ